MTTVAPRMTTTLQGNAAWLYVGRDERDRELEIIAVELETEGDGVLLVLHVMPTRLRGRDPDG